ncbi:MAG TPA: helix-turn-helix transcriptional regulator [Phnomibacter sp.]|nr:helix-turn-helix transcriptional regulator [Phnomibacter sp.]
MEYFLLQLRQCYGLTQAQLAGLLHTSGSTISRFLKGLRPLPADVQTRLALLYTSHMQVVNRPVQAALKTGSPATVASQNALQMAGQQAMVLQGRYNKWQKAAEQEIQLQHLLSVLMSDNSNSADSGERPAQRRCMEQLMYVSNRRLEHCNRRMEALQRLWLEAKREWVWQQYCLGQVQKEMPDLLEILPNNR